MLTPSAIPVSSSSVPSAIEVTVASLSNPAAELALIGTAVPQWAVCRTVAAGTDAATWYRLDATSGATNVPYVVASLTAGLKWVAIAGAYANTLTVQDGTLTVVGSSDATKTLKFEVDAQSTGADLTIDTGAQTADRTATFPVLTGNSILTLSNATLTTGRIPYATTNGILTDSTDLQFASRTIGLRRTPHAWGSNYCGIEQQGSALAEFYAAGNIQMGWFGNAYDDGVGTFKYSETDPSAVYRMFPQSRLFRWQTAPSGAADSAITFVTAMELSNTALTVASPVSVIVSNTTDSTTKDTGSIVTEGGIGAEKSIYAGGKVVAQDATAGTAVNTGSIQTLGGYSAWKATFLRGTQLQGDSAAMLAEYYSNQTSDPAAQRNCLSFAHYNSGATAGNTSTTAGVNGLVQNSSAVTLSDVRCFQAAISTTHASAVNTASYGYYFSNSTNTGTTTTKTGFYCEALTGTTVYSFRSAGAGLVSIGDTTDSTTKDTGSIVTEGGVGIEKALSVGTRVGIGAAPDASYGLVVASGAAAERIRITMTGVGSSGFYLTNAAVTDGGTIRWDATDHLLFFAGGGAGTHALKIGAAGSTFNYTLTLAQATGTTLTVSSADAASVSLAGGILLDGATTKTIKYTNGTANAAVAVTFGAVGPTGSTAGNQQGWLRVNIGGTDRYIPYW